MSACAIDVAVEHLARLIHSFREDGRSCDEIVFAVVAASDESAPEGRDPLVEAPERAPPTQALALGLRDFTDLVDRRLGSQRVTPELHAWLDESLGADHLRVAVLRGEALELAYLVIDAHEDDTTPRSRETIRAAGPLRRNDRIPA
jgi:hypothetical protein